jgi:predicted dehydrogenase
MTYRAGIIGTGGIAGMGILGMHPEEKIGAETFRASHAGGYREADGIELVAAADVDDEKRTTFGEAWDLPDDRLYADHRGMLDAEDLDAMSVCTPTYLHHDHVMDAASAASPPDVIWCEKPIAASVSDAEAMVAACEEAGAELVVNHSFRFTDKVERLRDLLREEALLGEVKAVNAQFRRELMRNSTHLPDLLIHLLDARASRVAGFINEQNDAVEALEAGRAVDDSGGGGFVVTDDGTFATVDCTVAREISSMAIQFVGTEGKLYLNNDDGEWRYWALEDGNHAEESLSGVDGAWSWSEDYRNAFPNAARHVVGLLDGEATNRSPGEEATRSLEIIVAFYVSHYAGSLVSVPLARPLRDVTVTSW